MTTLPSLKVLQDNRDALLLAEVAAWLHDIRKCADEHIVMQSSDRPEKYSYDYKKRYPSLLPSETRLSILEENITIKELVEEASTAGLK